MPGLKESSSDDQRKSSSLPIGTSPLPELLPTRAAHAAVLPIVMRECLAAHGDEASFCALMRRHVRRLIDFSSAAVLLETSSGATLSRLLIRIDMPPRFLRALFLAGRLLANSDF